MDEKLISKTVADKRVNYNFIINNKINCFSAMPENKPNKIVIYVHGLGSKKIMISRFYNELLDDNIGVIAFDLPCHGEDKTSFSTFGLNICLTYFEEVINYVKSKYHLPIYLFGCSYGGFVILNRLIRKNSDIKKTILMCPAVNFCDILEDRAKMSLTYFKTNEFMNLYRDVNIYKDAYIEFKKGNNNIKNANFKNVYIIHGTDDPTVNYNDVKKFCDQKGIELKTIPNGKHGLYGYDKTITDFIIKIVNVR